MIKPEQIPDAVIIAACEEYGGGHLYDMRHAIAAAINAWPDSEVWEEGSSCYLYPKTILLPPTEDK